MTETTTLFSDAMLSNYEVLYYLRDQQLGMDRRTETRCCAEYIESSKFITFCT